MNKSNKFIFFASGISKELIFKSYQNKIIFLKFPSSILMILMLKAKPFCQAVKQVDDKKVFIIFIVRNGLLLTTIRVFFNIILLIAISSVHLMFPGSLSGLKMSQIFVRLRQSLHQSQPHIRVYFLLCIRCVRGKIP